MSHYEEDHEHYDAYSRQRSLQQSDELDQQRDFDDDHGIMAQQEPPEVYADQRAADPFSAPTYRSAPTFRSANISSESVSSWNTHVYKSFEPSWDNSQPSDSGISMHHKLDLSPLDQEFGFSDKQYVESVSSSNSSFMSVLDQVESFYTSSPQYHAPSTQRKFLERYTHFDIEETTFEVARRVASILKDGQVTLSSSCACTVDFSFVCDPNQCMFDGYVYVDNHKLHVIVYLWSDEESNSTIVEFQRRQGNGLSFASFFRCVGDKIKQLDLEPSVSSGVCSNPKEDGFGDIVDDKDHSVCTHLISMVKSQFAEEQLEGAQALASLTANATNCEAVLHCRGLDACVEALSSQLDDVVRCAAAAIGNVASCTRSSCSHVLQKHNALTALVSAIDRTEEREVVRQAASTIAQILSHCPSFTSLCRGGVLDSTKAKLQKIADSRSIEIASRLNV